VNCAEARDLAPELALGVLSGAERAEVLLHVNGCARCQALVVELTEVVDALVTVGPEAEPSRGFEQRVLTEIALPRRRNRRRLFSAIAVAAAVAAILSITIVRIVESDTGAGTPSAAPVAATMVGGQNGAHAGWVSVADRHAVTVAVDYGIPAGTYHVEVKPEQGSPFSLGPMQIDNGGRGFWTGTSNVPITGGSTIELVGADGQTACHGTLSTTQ
jgi:hypothetical protein